MGFSDLLIKAFETFVINEPASAGFFIKGHLASTTLHPYSVSRVLRRALTRSGVAGERHSGHSLRHGFATWASRNQWSDSAERYLQAARRASTQRRYAQATKASRVRDVLRGIQALHPQPIKQAEALQLQMLEACIEGMAGQLTSDLLAVRLRAARDQALILMGFWRALRGDELCRLRVEHIQLREGQALEIFLASSKTDRDHRGRTLLVPALKRLCPVDAYQHWLAVSGINQGPVFRAIDRWGRLAEERVNPNSLSRILRLAFLRNGVTGAGYTAHSLRRGFATWASRNQWSSKALMEYVGWRDVQSAIRYIEADVPFGDWAR